uniref:ATPase AAA-type core domain-containing protein n=1 Tax=Magnetococcus massalia (strain MO-1) TaxID=451514 RepID=A0A1S7LNQ3_MAGMO|nr:Conserved protein of unknown function. Putative ATPase involved into the DNA repair [Candidatus Magnetococcus massalia]
MRLQSPSFSIEFASKVSKLAWNLQVTSMIHEFSVTNFGCFNEEATVSFVVPLEEDDTRSFIAPSGQRLMKAIALVGPNGSGKSMLLEALDAVLWFLKGINLISEEHGRLMPPHMFHKEEKTQIQLSFELSSGRVFKYILIVQSYRVVEEALYEKNASSNRWNIRIKRTQIVTSDPQNVQYDINYYKCEGFHFDKRQYRPQANDQSSLFPELIKAKETQPLLNELDSFFKLARSNFSNRIVGRPAGSIMGYAYLAQQLLDSKKLLEVVSRYLRQLDVGIQGIEVEEVKLVVDGKEKKGPRIKTIHEYNGQRSELHLYEESQGTRSTAHLIELIALLLEYHGIGMIDELEEGLHPRVFDSVLNLFLDPEHNRENAQFIFTTHRYQVLNRLGRYGVVFTEKEDGVHSEAWRLDEISGVRKGTNLAEKYIAGAFGAVPKGAW